MRREFLSTPICAALAFLIPALSTAQHLRNTYQQSPSVAPDGQIRMVQAAGAGSFLDSIGVVTKFGGGYFSTPYRKQTTPLIQALISSGIRHIRDGGTYHDADYRTLAAAGIRITYVVDPKIGIVPSKAYWCDKFGHKDCVSLSEYLKQLGPGAVDAIESLNEVNGFYRGYRWHAGLNDEINNVQGDRNHWLNYAEAFTKDICQAVHADPQLAGIKCLTPSLTGSSPQLFRPSEFWGIADYGNIHPYPYGGNPHSTPLVAYDGVDDYFHWTTCPAINIDEFPWWLDQMGAFVGSPDGKPGPLMVTETGYYTGTGSRSIPEEVHGKYVPRLFAEYFRHGIVRTFWYELVDESANTANSEASYGLLRHDLTPKPGMAALQSLMQVLGSKSEKQSVPAHPLSFGLSVQPSGAFTRLQYVHDLLLQKSDGTYELLLWHEISDVATNVGSGTLPSTDAELHPPAMTTIIELPADFDTATLYSYDKNWQLQPKTISVASHKIASHKIVVPVTDAISVLELSNHAQN